ncbi:hypothetical protein Bca52824_087589 [Brassica carinata]|uniref:Uncharacterized protein n=1 Tax=Brassica carinata TaxID=52824 RepID=A0A8X7P9Z9_BRACI|nr:hypothetical protein Bca52824_087589 [Brassica carinata]
MHLTPNSQVFLSELESGRCSSKVEVRLLRFWEYRYVRRGGELIISVDMLLIDWKPSMICFAILIYFQSFFLGTLMPATVNASRVPTFRPHLTAERYILSPDLMWLCCNPNFRDVFVTLSMFDSNTVSFHKRLEAMRGDPRKWLEFWKAVEKQGNTSFYKRLGLQTAPLLRGYAKVETLTISERNEFIITALTQDIDFICTGKVTSSKIEKMMMFCCLL